MDVVGSISAEKRFSTDFTDEEWFLIGFGHDMNSLTVDLNFDGNNGSTIFLDKNLIAQDIRFSNGATATAFTLVDYADFGAEVRSIASASIYGTFGMKGNGPGVRMYLISHNFAYIGNDYNVDNDANTVIQANEVVATNGAKIF